MFRLYQIITVGAACLVSFNLNAQSIEHDPGQQKAHIHGHAELTLVLEQNILEISLESPAANIVGFEHKATSSHQLQVVENAKSMLESTAQLFTFIGSECVVLSAKADLSALLKHEQRSHQADAEPHEDKHNEITANYRFTCQSAAKLENISINVIDHFPAIEEINAMWITEDQQGSAKLTTNNKTIQIR